jgi:hypothetical protein
MTIKAFIVSTLTVIILSFIGGYFTCKSLHEEPKEVVYDINHIADSVIAANKHSDTVIIKLESKIKHEKGKLIETFIAIDSLSFDSAYWLWSIESRLYKPIY